MSRVAQFRQFYSDPDRKGLARIVAESVRSGFAERELPIFYFTSLMYKRSVGDYRKFIGRRRIHRVQREVFAGGPDITLLEDKTRFAHYMEERGLPSPRILAHTEGMTIVSGESRHTIDDFDDAVVILRQICARSSSGRIFVKSREGMGGKTAFKIDATVDADDVRDLRQLMRTQSLLLQEQIVQADEIDRLYPHSINTVRIHTYRRSPAEAAEVFGALLRVGTGGRLVDNGGLFAPIDQATWTLGRVGWSLLQRGGRTFAQHPDTGIRFEGYQVPFGDQVTKICQKAAAAFERSFIAWDIALTPDGPTIIEGNHNPHLIMAQIASGGIKGDKHFSPALDHLV